MLANILLVLNIFILDSMLSVDNAAALSLLVRNLPKEQQSKALKYGIIGAFLFRGFFLWIAFFALHWFTYNIWIQIVAGVWLVWIGIAHFTRRVDSIEEIKSSRFGFWGTVLLVEIMDIAFSVDNIFAAVAMTNIMWIILVGVFLSIVAMRFVAIWFTGLLKRYPYLETSAFIVIFLLGIKMLSVAILSLCPGQEETVAILSSHTISFWFSGLMMAIFFGPLLFQGKIAEHIDKEY